MAVLTIACIRPVTLKPRALTSQVSQVKGGHSTWPSSAATSPAASTAPSSGTKIKLKSIEPAETTPK